MPPITVVIADGDKTGRARSLNILQAENGISGLGVARNGLEAILAAEGPKPKIPSPQPEFIQGIGRFPKPG
jgi:hypothetical protein